MFPDQEAAFRAVRESTRRLATLCGEAEAFLKRYKRHSIEQLHLPADPSILIGSIFLEAAASARLCNSLSQARAANMPTVRLNELNGTIAALEAAVSSFNSTADTLEKDNRPLKMFRAGRVEGALTSEEYYNFGPILTEVFQRIDGLRNSPALIGVQNLNLRLETKYAETAAEVARNVGALRDKADELLAEIQAKVADASAEKEGLERSSAEISAEWQTRRDELEVLIQAAEAAKVATESSQSAVKMLADEAEANTATLAKAASDAENEIESINTFSGDVSKIQSELEAIRDAAAAGSDAQKEYLVKVRELVREAEGMVSGATTAGLAKAFDDERKRLSTGMGWALFSFLVGIVFLFLTTILLAAYVFEIPIDIFGYNVGQAGQTPERGDEITLAGVLSRTVILLAPFWLTLFSSRRYRNLFDLRQQYTHKYSMAFSVDGFKQQAPNYAEQMAAWVFHVVSEPPVSVKNSRGMGDNPLPDINSVIKEQIERFDILKKKGDE